MPICDLLKRGWTFGPQACDATTLDGLSVFEYEAPHRDTKPQGSAIPKDCYLECWQTFLRERMQFPFLTGRYASPSRFAARPN